MALFGVCLLAENISYEAKTAAWPHGGGVKNESLS